jgi:hypothetical protein
MNIIEALQDKNNRLRISDGCHWLVWDEDEGWIVYERRPYARKTTVIIKTRNETDAIAALLENSGG